MKTMIKNLSLSIMITLLYLTLNSCGSKHDSGDTLAEPTIVLNDQKNQIETDTTGKQESTESIDGLIIIDEENEVQVILQEDEPEIIQVQLDEYLQQSGEGTSEPEEEGIDLNNAVTAEESSLYVELGSDYLASLAAEEETTLVETIEEQFDTFNVDMLVHLVPTASGNKSFLLLYPLYFSEEELKQMIADDLIYLVYSPSYQTPPTFERIYDSIRGTDEGVKVNVKESGLYYLQVVAPQPQ